MKKTVAVVDYQMESDTDSDVSQGIEENPPKDIIKSSKLKIISDLEKSFKLKSWGVLSGMVGADFELRFYGPHVRYGCHRFMLAVRSEVFHSIFMENPEKKYWKIELGGFSEDKSQSL